MFKSVCGEKASVDPEAYSTWKDEKLPKYLAEYQQENIFNAEKTDLFYRLLPEKTLNFKKMTIVPGPKRARKGVCGSCSQHDWHRKMPPGFGRESCQAKML